jgi:hypothetical protein
VTTTTAGVGVDDRAWRSFLDAHGELAWSDDPYNPETTSANFDLDAYLARFDPRLLASPEGRKALTRLDPMLFALVYMRKHLRNNEGDLSFADAHFLWVRAARRWIGPPRGQREDRKAFVAPRSCGKSTWWFLILPMWAGAHGHARFAAAFADSGAQAELHLATFKRELSDNPLLRADFEDLCEPKRRHNGKTINDSQNMLFTKSGFAFAARGIDSTSLGMKVDEVRPDLLIFDDIEPPESNYSPFQRDKRLSTVQNAILPLNELARVVVVGTVTMPGSIIHELVRHAKGEDVEPWVEEEKFKTFHTRPIIPRPDGTERSVWPKKWTLDYLQSIRHTRSFKLNYDNDPKGRQGDYWNEEDIKYGTPPNITKWFLFVDPPVTQKTKSDYAGVALVGYAPGVPKAAVTRDELTMYGRDRLLEMLTAREVAEAAEGRATRLSRVCIVDAWQVKLTGAPLKRFLLDKLAEFPQVQAVVIENNQGGDLWVEVMNGLPVKLVTYGSHESKEVRFARALDLCQKNRVTFGRIIPPLEDQMLGFPRLANDDLLDAVCAGMLRLLTPKLVQKDGTLTPR